jgi:hypothetical protein
MSKYPKLKFELNLDLDIDIGTEFLGVQGGGIDFGKHIVELHPDLSLAKSLDGDIRKKKVGKYTKEYYQLHNDELQKAVRKFSKNWEEREHGFFEGVKGVFDSHPWPEGRYICYLSIYDCNPRFLEDKTFQVYFRHPQGSNHIIAHEMLHFIFFDYLDRKEVELKNRVDEGTIWLLSELFDDKVLELPEFGEFKSKDGGSYPEVAEFAKKFKGKQKGKFDIKTFFQTTKTIL